MEGRTKSELETNFVVLNVVNISTVYQTISSSKQRYSRDVCYASQHFFFLRAIFHLLYLAKSASIVEDEF
jgi:hypothetical protein